MCAEERLGQPPCRHAQAAAAAVSLVRGSRRRRLWDLAPTAYCPVIGVCVPLPLLRRVAQKVVDAPLPQDDYELHCAAITESKSRTALAERLQRELDERFAPTLAAAARCKSTPELAQWWQRQLQDGEAVPAAFWAALTHARCDAVLEERVLRDIHMLQHQVGAAERVDRARFAELAREHGVLVRELAAAQQRSTQALAQRTACIEQQAAELVRLRAALIARDTALQSLRAEVEELRAGMPDLPARRAQAEQITRQQARIDSLERRLAEALRTPRATEPQARGAGTPGPVSPEAAEAPAASVVTALPLPPRLRDKAVLCVGGRSGSVPVYRQLVERTGGQFLHHDGGEEDSPAQLESSLAAADLVICQTGCISHGAYWRVKDHCKRTGKQCVFVDKPSAAGLMRGLQEAASLLPPGQEATVSPATSAVQD
ncbi:DUF2325 domain-containing protein [Azohydromonas caseinilytica]|uniref:DUF2325 domain-containing protein n=1 Tax=Azohydromonas caseinilytica TaxID=2728836 RepID=A0A848FEE3_9BURK|nr:DUF2325 domain-containing protein [Azohydromonas caseinilytica]NML16643.1 DUF2325 domain-containing protein [Azohydromonas caseinilytica]